MPDYRRILGDHPTAVRLFNFATTAVGVRLPAGVSTTDVDRFAKANAPALVRMIEQMQAAADTTPRHRTEDTIPLGPKITLLQPRLNKQDKWPGYTAQLPGGADEGYHRVTARVFALLDLSPAQYDDLVTSFLTDRPQWFRNGGHEVDFVYVIEVRAPGRRTLYVNPEGHEYARYVLFPEDATADWRPTVDPSNVIPLSGVRAPRPPPTDQDVLRRAVGSLGALPGVATVDVALANRLSVEGVTFREGEETECFVATLLLDGDPLARVSNAGTGGAHEWQPLSDSPRGLNEWRATLREELQAATGSTWEEVDDDFVLELAHGATPAAALQVIRGRAEQAAEAAEDEEEAATAVKPVDPKTLVAGQRVVWTDRHGIAHHGELLTLGQHTLTMSGPFGAGRETSTYYSPEIRLDSGRTVHLTDLDGIQFEAGLAPVAVPDIHLTPPGSTTESILSPKEVWDAAGYRLRSERKFTGKAERARGAAKRAEHEREAAKAHREAQVYAEALRRWRAKHPDEVIPEVDPLTERITLLTLAPFRTGPEDAELQRLERAPQDWATRWQVGMGVRIPIAGSGETGGFQIREIRGTRAIVSSNPRDPGVAVPLWFLRADHAADAPVEVAPVEARPVEVTPQATVDPEEYTAELGRLLLRLKADAGVRGVRQGYKGTGTKRASRQVFLRWPTGEQQRIDLWLYPERVTLGGVIGATGRSIPYQGREPAEVYPIILAALRAWRAGEDVGEAIQQAEQAHPAPPPRSTVPPARTGMPVEGPGGGAPMTAQGLRNLIRRLKLPLWAKYGSGFAVSGDTPRPGWHVVRLLGQDREVPLGMPQAQWAEYRRKQEEAIAAQTARGREKIAAAGYAVEPILDAQGDPSSWEFYVRAQHPGTAASPRAGGRGAPKPAEFTEACREIEFDLPGHGRIRVVCGAVGQKDTWHNIYVGRERYGWNGSRWARSRVPAAAVLQAVRERGIGAFPER